MAKNPTKNKSPLVTILVVVLALILIASWDDIKMYGENPVEALYYWAMDAVDGVLEPDILPQSPGDTDSGDSTDTSTSIDLLNPDLDIILAAVPKHLRSNYFLTYKEAGCCKSLTGSLYVTVVMISDSVSTWDDAAVQKLQAALNDAALDIVSEAKAYSTEVSISFGYHYAELSGDICSGDYSNDWQDPALESAGLPGLAQMHEHITGMYQVKEAPVLFVFNKESRAYASTGGNEFLVLFSDGDFGGFQHELSHVFGAKDFYYPSEIKELAGSLLPDSIMNSGEIADPLTAYLIGWTQSLSDSALEFLEDTNSITVEYMNQQGDIESFTGNGSKVFEYGSYTGDLIRGVCNGTGTMNYNDGSWYTGGWTNGKWSGNGTGKYIYSDGSVYEGEYLDGVRHGTGTYTYADGAVYTGGWTNGEQDGTGTINYANGGWYTGGWTNGSWSGNGSGKYIYSDGSVYEGGFLNGEFHGTGTYSYADGTVYTGGWANGKQHGIGTINYTNGGWYTGGWSNGSRSGTGTGKDVYSNGVYEGAFKDGNRHGQGTYTWAEGDSYTGQWENGERNGFGTYTWADGSSQSGNWKDGKFVG